MIKIIGYILIALALIFVSFGFLILIEYLRYFKRKIVLRLRNKLKSEVPKND